MFTQKSTIYCVWQHFRRVVLEGTPKKRRRNRALSRFVCRLAESAPHVLVVLLLVVAAAVVLLLLLLWLLCCLLLLLLSSHQAAPILN